MFCALGLIFGVGARFHVLRSRTRFRRNRGLRVSFSRFVPPDSFSEVPGALGPFSGFARPDSFLAAPRALGPVFMFCELVLVFGGTQGIGSRFHVLRARARFRRYPGRRVPFSYFARPYSFSVVPKASDPVFMFCAPELFFDGTMGVPYRFHVFRSRTCFRLYRGRRVHFTCFAFSDSFSTVQWASGPVFLFCAPGLIFGGSEGAGSRFHVLRACTHFRRYRGRRVPFSCFACPDSFSEVSMASCPVFMFCAPGLVFSDTEGVGSRFHVLRAQSRFQRYRGRRVPFS
jgi:hypothetical protein